MTLPALQRKVEVLEQAQLKMRFQIERLAGAGVGESPVTFTPKEFATRINRSEGWVRRQIRNRHTDTGIKAFGPPYIIPGSELVKFI